MGGGGGKEPPNKGGEGGGTMNSVWGGGGGGKNESLKAELNGEGDGVDTDIRLPREKIGGGGERPSVSLE